MGHEASVEGKAASVREMFDSIAPRYDALNWLLSFGVDDHWRRRAIRAVQRTEAHEVLDLACGTGDMTRLLLKHSKTCEQVYAVDASRQMLVHARAKAWPRGMREKVTFLEAGAESLPWEDESVGAVMVSFGVRNFADSSKALREMYRVLRPGGGVVVLEFSTPHGAIFKRLYKFYFRRCLPLVGGVISRDKKAYRYLPESVYAFPEGEAFLQELRGSGFANGVSRRMTGGIATLYEARKPMVSEKQ